MSHGYRFKVARIATDKSKLHVAGTEIPNSGSWYDSIEEAADAIKKYSYPTDNGEVGRFYATIVAVEPKENYEVKELNTGSNIYLQFSRGIANAPFITDWVGRKFASYNAAVEYARSLNNAKGDGGPECALYIFVVRKIV